MSDLRRKSGVSESVYRRVLGSELDLLAPEFRPFFDGVNTPTLDGGFGSGRTFHFPSRDCPLQDRMCVVDGRLHDFLGRGGGFEVCMALTVTEGRTQLRSDRLWLSANHSVSRCRRPQVGRNAG